MDGEGNGSGVRDGEGPERRPDFDWLRAITILCVMAQHVGFLFIVPSVNRISDYEPWLPMWFLTGFLHQWHMALLFTLAGAAAWYALRVRSTGRYLKERITRLFVPCLFGTLVIVPPQVYYARFFEGTFEGSYWEFYPRFFKGIWPTGNLTWAHLWFIMYLLVISLLTLPVLVYFTGPSGRRLTGRLAAFCEKPGAIYLLALPLGLTQALLLTRFPWNWALANDWAMLSWYLCLFVLGFVIASDQRFWHAIRKQGWAALLYGTLATSLWFGVELMGVKVSPDWPVTWVLFTLFFSFRTWFWVIALLALGMKFLQFENRLLRYLRQASYPVYILHQTIMIVVGFYVLRWNAPKEVRFLIILAATLGGSLLVYEIAVRRWSVMRFLFGMKPKPKAPRATAIQCEGAGEI